MLDALLALLITFLADQALGYRCNGAIRCCQGLHNIKGLGFRAARAILKDLVRCTIPLLSISVRQVVPDRATVPCDRRGLVAAVGKSGEQAPGVSRSSGWFYFALRSTQTDRSLGSTASALASL